MPETFILLFVCFALAAYGLLASRRLFEYPTMMGLLSVAFLVPQVLAIERSHVASAYDAGFAWIYIIACLLLATLGFHYAKKRAEQRARKTVPSAVDERSYAIGAIVLVTLGLVASARVGTMAFESEQGAQWTGEITLWYLFMQATFFALAIATLRYLRTGKTAYLVIGAVALVAVLVIVSGNVKRSLFAEILIIGGGAWFFVRGRQPPKIAVVIVCVIGTVILHQVGAIRSYINEGRGGIVGAFVEGVPFERLEYFNADKAPELTLAVIDIYAAHTYGKLEGLSETWNNLVHQYVPAFVLGSEFKDSLKFHTNPVVDGNSVLSSYAWAGVTRTGFSDSYRGFWFAGCVLFLLIGMFMGTLYGYAIAGRVWAQFYYLVLLNDSLFALTESVARFISILPFVFIVTWVFLRPHRLREKLRGRTNTAIVADQRIDRKGVRDVLCANSLNTS